MANTILPPDVIVPSRPYIPTAASLLELAIGELLTAQQLIRKQPTYLTDDILGQVDEHIYQALSKLGV